MPHNQDCDDEKRSRSGVILFMIKSVTIKDDKGVIIFKIICHKNGSYDMTKAAATQDIYVDVRDEKNQKVFFGEKRKRSQGNAR